MSQPPKLASQSSQQTRTRNQFLRSFHHKQIANTGLLLDVRDDKPEKTLELVINFVFDSKYAIKIACTPMPFLDEIARLCKPWQWHELSPALAHLALDHIFLSEKKQALPEGLVLQDFSLNKQPSDHDSEHYRCVLQGKQEYQLDIWAHHDFPFKRFAQRLGIGPRAEQIYPPELYHNMPIEIAAATLSAKEFSTLAKGDIILIAEPSNDHAA